jgi:hypothetical protein
MYNNNMATFKEYLRRVVWQTVVTVLVLFGIWEAINLGLSQLYGLYIPIDVYGWIDIALLVFIGFNIWGFHKMVKERNNAKKNEDLYKQNLFTLQRKLEQSSDKPIEQTFEDDLKVAKIGWGLWYTGTKIMADKSLNAGVIKRVLLLNPDPNNEALKQIVRESDTNIEGVLTDIRTLTEEIAKLNRHLGMQINIRWYEEYRPQSFTIFDTDPVKDKKGHLEPSSPNAWIVVKYLEPLVGAGHRKLDRVFKATHPERFNAYFELYKRIWTQAKKPQ